MNRLDHILDELKYLGYCVFSMEKVVGGINSAVYMVITTTGMHYALKVYPQEVTRNRFSTEFAFLDYLDKCSVLCVPKVLEYNHSNGWILLNWIFGHKIDRLSNASIKEISSFIGLINLRECKILRRSLAPASDSFQSIHEIIYSIGVRFDNLLSHKVSSNIEAQINNWLSKSLKPLFAYHSQILTQRAVNASHWTCFIPYEIASPSDVGIHNLVYTSSGLFFFDFEYAGLDDLSKLTGDWVMQPNYYFSELQEATFIVELLQNMQHIDYSWVERLHDLKPLIAVKWCLIMLNGLNRSSIDIIGFKRVLSYAKKSLNLDTGLLIDS